VHGLPSSQVLPSASTGFEQAPVVESQVPAAWQLSDGVQLTGVPPRQVPAWQLSATVQALPSLQVVPSGAGGLVQPMGARQTPATWQASSGRHTTGLVPTQVPAWQLSVCVQMLPSMQWVPSGAFGVEQTPVDGSQLPATWHWAGVGQVTGFDPLQAPA
jgi:hypothetical protein